MQETLKDLQRPPCTSYTSYNAYDDETPPMLTTPQMLQMSTQKYKRTNFEEEENSGVELASRQELPSPASNFDPTVSFQHYKVTFWKRRTFMEKVLIILLLIFFLFSAVLLILLATWSKPPEASKAEIETCEKKVCINAASSILNSIDLDVDPCDDFYHFACGNWIRSNPIPHGSRYWDTFMEIREGNMHVLKEFIESPPEKQSSDAERKMKTLYRSCIDENNQREQLGIQPLIPLFKVLGGWSVSVIDDVVYNETAPWDLQDLLTRSFSVLNYVFFGFEVTENDREPSSNMLRLRQGDFLDKNLVMNKTKENIKKLNARKAYFMELAVLLGGKEEEAGGYLDEVLQLEEALVMMTDSLDKEREDAFNFNIKNVSELQASYPFLDWLTFMNKQLSEGNVSINASEPVLINNHDFFQQLTTFLNATTQTMPGRRSIQNFVVWKMVLSFAPHLSSKFSQAHTNFYKIYWDIVGEQDEWKDCLALVETQMGFAVGAMFVRHKFEPESKLSATKMIVNIKKAFIENLPSLSWMDPPTRQAAIHKANAMEYLIGYPDFILNNTLLDAYYSKIEPQEDTYFGNLLSIFFSNSRNMFSKLRAANDKLQWSMSPSDVNAYYAPNRNHMVFPAGILQGRFFNKDLPDSINYGSIGMVVGHELTHGFDDQGNNFDADGVFRQWWDEKIKQNFHNRTQCLVNQYSRYQVDGMNLNGKFTLGENIADNGGIKSAFNAYISLDKREPLLPGVPYNHKQLFFIAFAQGWCNNIKKSDQQYSILNDLHSISQYRIIGATSNSKHFAEAFSCARDSPMNPTEKCEVW